MSQFTQAWEGVRIAVGHDPRSPFYRHRPTVRQQIREEMHRWERGAERRLFRLPGFRTAQRDTRRMQTALALGKANPYAGAAYVVVHPVSAGRSFLRLFLLMVFWLWILYIAVLQPTVDRYLGWVPDSAPGMEEYGRLREFDRNLPPGWRPIPGAPWAGVVPGSVAGCPSAQAASGPRARVGGWEGVGHALGSLAHSGVKIDLSMQNFEDGILDTARGVGTLVRAFGSAARDGGPAPTEPLRQPVPGAASGLATPASASPVGVLTDAQVAQLARAVGWPEEEVASGRVGARVRAESGNDPAARDYADGSHQGLLQLGQAEQAAYLDAGASVLDPQSNLRGALRLWEARGWQPWAASDAGHVRYIEDARESAADAGRVPVTSPAGCADAPTGALAGPPTSQAEAELSANALAARRAVLARWPGTTIGGWGERGGRKTEHDDRDATGRKASRALDVMTYDDTAKGEAVAQWTRAGWDELRVGYMIWNRRIWLSPDSSKPYNGPSPHTDHPHITFLPDDASA